QLATIERTERVIADYLARAETDDTYTAPPEKTTGIIGVETLLPTLDDPALRFRVRFRADGSLSHPVVGTVVYALDGTPLFGTNSHFHPPVSPTRDAQEGIAVMTCMPSPLWSGTYKASFWLSDAQMNIDTIVDAVSFTVVS